MKIIPLEIIHLQEHGTHILVEVEIFQHKRKMVIDTGASKSVLDTTEWKKMLEEDVNLKASNILSTGLGTNAMESATTIVDQINIGNWKVNTFTIAVMDLSTINYAYNQLNLDSVLGIIGGDIFHPYGAVINYQKKTLTLRDRKIKNP